jgi:hypothetical protein
VSSALFQAFARSASSRKILLVEQDLVDPATGLVVDPLVVDLGRWATHHFTNRPSDAPANVYYVPRVKGGFELTRSLVDGKRLRGSSLPDYGTLQLINVDGGLHALADYVAAGQALRFKLGSHGWPIADFETVFDGLAESLQPSRDGRVIVLRPESADRVLKVPIQSRKFLGLGQALLHDGANDQEDAGDTCDVGATDSFFLQVKFRGDAGEAGTTEWLAGKRTTAAGYQITLDTAGLGIVAVDSGAGAVTVTGTSAGDLRDGNVHTILLVLDRAAAVLRSYIDGVLQGSTSAAGIGSLVNAHTLRFGERSDGTLDFHGYLIEVAWALRAPIDSEILEWSSRLLDWEEDRCLVWSINEGAGPTAFQAHDLVRGFSILDGVDDSLEVGLPTPLYVSGAPSYSVELLIHDGAPGTFKFLWSEGNSGVDTQWLGLVSSAINAADLQYIVTDDAGVQRATITWAGVLGGQGPRHLVLVDDGGLVALYVNGALLAPTAGTNPYPLAGWNCTVNRTTLGALLRTGAFGYWAGRLHAARLWRRPLAAAEIPALAHATTAADPTVLAVQLLLDEGSGTPQDSSGNNRTITLTGATWGTINAAITGSTWTSSFEGDASLAGKPWPTSWGEVPHREAWLIDQIELVYAVHFRAVHDIDGVYEGGGKLIPNRSETSTDVRFHSGTKRIINVGGQDWRSYKPGQTITVGGSAGNVGDKTVATVDEVAGRWLSVQEAVTSELAGPSITIATATGTHDWTDLGDGLFQLENPATKPVTCRLRGDAEGGYVDTVPAMMERIAVDMGGWDPAKVAASFAAVEAAYPGFVAGYATGLKDETIDVVMSRLAVSLGATWGVTTANRELDLLVVGPPDPDPAPEDLLEITENEILRMEWQRTEPPVLKVVANHRPNFRVLTFDELIGAVQEDRTAAGQAWAKFLQEEWTRVEKGEPAGASPSLAELYPLAEPEDVVNTYLVKPAHARVIAEQEFAKYGAEREFFAVDLKLQPYLYDFRRATVRATHERWASTAAGKDFRMVEVKLRRTGTTLELWG